MMFVTSKHVFFEIKKCRNFLKDNDLKVPFLVMEQCMDSPLIGFHVIEESIEGSNGDAASSKVITSSLADLAIKPLQYL